MLQGHSNSRRGKIPTSLVLSLYYLLNEVNITTILFLGLKYDSRLNSGPKDVHYSYHINFVDRTTYKTWIDLIKIDDL